MAIFAVSCKKFVQISPAPNTLTSSEIFADSADATAALLGVYSGFNVGSYSFTVGNGAITQSTGLSSDELVMEFGPPFLIQFYQNALSSSTNSYLSGTLWTNIYYDIYQINACISGISASNGMSTSVKNQLLGEATFLRAFIYFNMVNLYGPVPLAVGTNYVVNEVLPRAPVDSVYSQVVKDLLSAESLLSTVYFTNGRSRPNFYTAAALLAKVYLYNQEWSLAETEATKVISSGIYALDSDLDSVFISNSSEAIWQLLSVQKGYSTSEALQFVPYANNVTPTYIISNYLLGSFENGDLRRSEWLDSNVVGGVVYYYPYKYKNSQYGQSSPAESYMVFRLAEQFLVRAEAECESNDLHDAIGDINVIRQRAGLLPSSLTESSQVSDVLNEIHKQRQNEMFCEWGNRWYDLKRWGIVNSVLSVEKSSWPSDGHAALFPIPFSEIQNDSHLIQNPGYQ